MTLPADLLHAVSAPGGGKIALVVGAGCSVEHPTSIPVASDCSKEIHRQLIADDILQDGDCADPADLSVVTDAVFAKKNSQLDVVERFSDQYDLKGALPNDGYLITAAMLCEGVIASVVTLNFDLALSNALIQLGATRIVGVIESPDDLPKQKIINVYYLHRNANTADPELWVLRTATLQHDWKGQWEPIITTKVLTAPVVVFAGLGTPVSVLIASTKLIRQALPAATKLYQVDPSDKASSRFFQELALDASAYIRRGWCQFMDELSQRLMKEHTNQFKQAVDRKVRDDKLSNEDVTDLLTRMHALGLVKCGKLRAHWLLHEKPYRPLEADDAGLIADLFLAIAMMARVSGAAAIIVEDGLVEFHRNGRVVAVYLIASGCGHRGRSAIEAKMEQRRRQVRGRPAPPIGVIISGTSDSWTEPVTPPTDVLRGDESGNDIVDEQAAFRMYHICKLRAHQNLIQQVVP